MYIPKTLSSHHFSKEFLFGYITFNDWLKFWVYLLIRQLQKQLLKFIDGYLRSSQVDKHIYAVCQVPCFQTLQMIGINRKYQRSGISLTVKTTLRSHKNLRL